MYLKKCNKKILRLLSLFFIQLTLIIAFILFGSLLSNSNNSLEVGETAQWSGNVKFISKARALGDSNINKTLPYVTPTFMKIIKNDDFHKHFYVIQHQVPYSSDIKEQLNVQNICYKEGTTHRHKERRAFDLTNDINNKTDYESSDNDNEMSSAECNCYPEWHGENCGQPEIVWRAFMTSRQHQPKPPNFVKQAHNIFYIINRVSNINIETLEIQIMELINIVNLFVLCDLVKSDDAESLLRHQMNTGFFELHRKQILLIKDETCSAKNVYHLMKKILRTQMHSSDVLIYSQSDEILNKKAINYFKWHNNWPQPVKFRLKYNVYGFYFKHPDSTIIGSVACQLNVLEQFYKSDPDLILTNQHNPTILVIGDLNHIGGWFCEYCYQPIDIIKKLHLDSKIRGAINASSTNNNNNLNNNNIFLTDNPSDPQQTQYHKQSVVNIERIHTLIQTGLYIDGKLSLIKLKHYNEIKYFTPDYVAKTRWKFDNIVTNLYASWEDDLDGQFNEY